VTAERLSMTTAVTGRDISKIDRLDDLACTDTVSLFTRHPAGLGILMLQQNNSPDAGPCPIPVLSMRLGASRHHDAKRIE
jgi:hypothetical protein